MNDCLIIGGGPAGLTAALYLARFRLTCAVLDGGHSRAGSIPRCRNFPGFPAGIPGPRLLSLMTEQLAAYDIAPLRAEASAIEISADGVQVETGSGIFAARTLLLATGTEDVRPIFADGAHDAALQAGLLHYCPVCDGYEASGKHIAVFGTGAHGAREALFLRSFSDDIDLVSVSGPHAMESGDRKKLQQACVRLIDGPASPLRMEANALHFDVGSLAFRVQSVYAALGCKQRSGLVKSIDAEISPEGCVVVDAHQRTRVKGVYAAGDVVVGLDQISTAIGQAAIAATTIRNDLRS